MFSFELLRSADSLRTRTRHGGSKWKIETTVKMFSAFFFFFFLFLFLFFFPIFIWFLIFEIISFCRLKTESRFRLEYFGEDQRAGCEKCPGPLGVKGGENRVLGIEFWFWPLECWGQRQLRTRTREQLGNSNRVLVFDSPFLPGDSPRDERRRADDGKTTTSYLAGFREMKIVFQKGKWKGRGAELFKARS